MYNEGRKNTVQFSASISKVETLRDGTLQLKIETPELPSAQMSSIFDLKSAMCMVAIAPVGTPVDKFDPATLDIPKDKSPSQRLRNVLYRVWEKNDQGYKDFDVYYPIKVDEIINHFKNKLD